MTARTELVSALLAALSTVEGVRPAPPMVRSTAAFNLDSLAIDAAEDLVRIRLVATALPLPPVLSAAGEVVAKTLVGTPFERAAVLLVVTDVDATAVQDRQIGA
ncbi:hypothetical protein HFP15_04470 [Amycolatopsis sp. K13G38]|uniref:Uncharacterized protein n=1 Tax=Amycolatopsis acididurans TaxID=2724524 RepID=A0ABX1J1J1_9PSEU|nr:hypothetical protein [Amycolatopsis acididurans]NKQ52132.1 hypothetical protein [Amycolatopsis acididurans]